MAGAVTLIDMISNMEEVEECPKCQSKNLTWITHGESDSMVDSLVGISEKTELHCKDCKEDWVIISET